MLRKLTRHFTNEVNYWDQLQLKVRQKLLHDAEKNFPVDISEQLRNLINFCHECINGLLGPHKQQAKLTFDRKKMEQQHLLQGYLLLSSGLLAHLEHDREHRAQVLAAELPKLFHASFQAKDMWQKLHMGGNAAPDQRQLHARMRSGFLHLISRCGFDPQRHESEFGQQFAQIMGKATPRVRGLFPRTEVFHKR